jgi:uncharacterized repeat protein (TIGR03803 family)
MLRRVRCFASLLGLIALVGTTVPCTAIGHERTSARASHGEAVLFAFDALDGANPSSGLIADSNGVLYGTTGGGVGAGNAGSVYSLTPRRGGYLETVLFAFKKREQGWVPSGGLIEDASGALYGTTVGGGRPGCKTFEDGGCGTVFKLTPSPKGYVETVLYAFTGKSDGALPQAGLIADAGGALYGTTSAGGLSSCTAYFEITGCGTVFKLSPSASGYTESVVYAYGGGTDGQSPWAGLIADANGVLYGTTEFGGGSAACKSGCGAVFRLTPNGGGYTESIVHAFEGGDDGANPLASLSAASDGTLYGTTLAGGKPGNGTAFSLTPTPSSGGYSETVLYAFAGAAGGRPMAALLPGAGGVLYGTASLGGSGGGGTVFALSPHGGKYTPHVFAAFQEPGQNSSGSEPSSPLISDAAGRLYGTAYAGGSAQCGSGSGCGLVFRVAR